MSGAGFQVTDFERIAESLRLGGNRASSSSSPGASHAQNLLEARFGTPGQPVDISMPELGDAAEDTEGEESGSDDEDGSHMNGAARSRKSSNKKGKAASKRVAMAVLVVDELDMVPENLRRKLLGWATEPQSSLLLVGMGNTVNYMQNKVVRTIDFKPYDEAGLVSIVRSLSCGLFEEKALMLLAKKICITRKCKNKLLCYLLGRR
jgi:hypothetical protein